MPRGSKPGVKRGPYKPHTRSVKLTDDMVRYLRQSVDSTDELYRWLLERGVKTDPAYIERVRRRQRKQGVPD